MLRKTRTSGYPIVAKLSENNIEKNIRSNYVIEKNITKHLHKKDIP